MSLLSQRRTVALSIAFSQAVIAMFGSLYFSEILGFPPCLLCWYQRIAMYPLVIILGVGIWLDDKRVHLYGLPLAFAGLLVAIYHNLIVYGVIPEKIAPCALGVSCLTKYVNWMGFITIPLLSLLSFVLIVACLFLASHAAKREG